MNDLRWIIIQIANQKSGGGECNGVKIISPNKVKELDYPLVLITTPNPKYIAEIKNKCEKMKVESRMADEVIFHKHINEIKKNLEYFYDEKSKEIYLEMINARMDGRNPNPKFVTSRSLYNLPEFFAHDNDGIFIDCGAFVGDSIENYIWDRENTYANVGKVIAFEPDENSFASLQIRIERLKKEWNFSDEKFVLYNAGVSDKTQKSYVEENTNGMSSKIVDNLSAGKSVEVYAIDDIVKDSFSYLKADIESYEYKMLCGARKSIKKYRPNLAICIYHNAVDFYQLPQLIHEICPDYKMIIRQHSYTVLETVLYAWY